MVFWPRNNKWRLSPLRRMLSQKSERSVLQSLATDHDKKIHFISSWTFLNDLVKSRLWLLFWHVQTQVYPSLVEENIPSFLNWTPSIRSRSISALLCLLQRKRKPFTHCSWTALSYFLTKNAALSWNFQDFPKDIF